MICSHQTVSSWLQSVCVSELQSVTCTQVVGEQQEESLHPNRVTPHPLHSLPACLLLGRDEAQAADHSAGSALLLLP